MSENSPTDSYKSISKPSTGIYKELGSKFFSFAYPVSSEEEIKNILAELRKNYFDARHHCYAYRLGVNGEIWRANDDGEPSSSSGKPILGQLLSKEISDVLVVVVRYFGGIKLGVPGLIRAYKAATIDAIDNTEIIEKIAVRLMKFSFDYMLMNNIMKLIREHNAIILEQQSDNLCIITVSIRESNSKRFANAIAEAGGIILTC
ncbi:MAG: YigZ family protein [Bacteroidetes bacterium GWF2_40_14]|nr:MAG: YigZ family protein [Bacteroidetes bacterium GWF2_40_14]